MFYKGFSIVFWLCFVDFLGSVGSSEVLFFGFLPGLLSRMALQLGPSYQTFL